MSKKSVSSSHHVGVEKRKNKKTNIVDTWAAWRVKKTTPCCEACDQLGRSNKIWKRRAKEKAAPKRTRPKIGGLVITLKDIGVDGTWCSRKHSGSHP
mmetsp:Transcript_95016/g.198594  ORF Transcript_95016/g.198594 Transcript_95016/m.198594 type:complete len:97 (+) Transcript_95016:40-330(+)